ncbi:glycoside hydrolase superfamily [Mycena olivaceomarginata]|nr:glycoside hydrolase superfamily [Mycena olivaceomarginata]
MPHDHAKNLTTYHEAYAATIVQTIDGRVDLVSGKYRYKLMAATILGGSSRICTHNSAIEVWNGAAKHYKTSYTAWISYPDTLGPSLEDGVRGHGHHARAAPLGIRVCGRGHATARVEIIPIIDSDTIAPKDYFRDVAREVYDSPDVVIIQHESGTSRTTTLRTTSRTPSGITVIDEYTLLQAGGQAALENHYKTLSPSKILFRIPIGYWAIEVLDGEEFLPNTSWQYLLKAVQWAQKYGLRINLDQQALPGSQNRWNHSGRLGTYNVLFGPMGIANAQVRFARSIYIRMLAEFISQPEYKDVILLFGVTNEPRGNSITQDILSRYYLQAYNNVGLAAGTGAGNGPYVSFHDGFLGPDQWKGYFPNADRASLDMHLYLCFSRQSADPITVRATQPCCAWGSLFNNTMSNFGFIVAGEFSNAVTDCGTYVNGVGQGARYEGTYTLDGSHPNSTKKAYLTFAKGSMDMLQNRHGRSATRQQALPAADEDELAKLNLIENLQQLSLTSDGNPRFFGRSSGAMLLKTALNIKLDAEPQNAQRHTEFWASRPVRVIVIILLKTHSKGTSTVS